MDLPMSVFAEKEKEQAAVGELKTAPANEGSEGQVAAIYDTVRFGMIRIQSIVAPVRWSRPYEQVQEQMGVGSGFAVEIEDMDQSRGPVFITNAHVVEDSRSVQVQLPAFSQVFFDAYVPLICREFDLAVVQLVEPRKLAEELARSNTTLKPLRIERTLAKMGMEVAAVGFPLGTTSLKLSRGIVAGTEEVDGAVCYQTTAPISPGSSGGPLLALGSLSVVGANFATSAKGTAQNINYVVPVLHIRKILFEFRRITRSENPPLLPPPLPEAEVTKAATGTALLEVRVNPAEVRSESSSLRGAAKAQANQTLDMNSSNALGHGRVAMTLGQLSMYHTVLKVAPIDVSIVEANDALYEGSGGCQSGVFLSHMEASSVLRRARPPVPPRSFVVSVANISVDGTGAGRADAFLGDPTPFQSLFTLWEDIDKPVVVTTCHKGKEMEHKVPMRWLQRYEQGLDYVREPHLVKDALDFESFAGVLVMRMTLDHIVSFLGDGASPTLGRWLLPENRARPRLVITDVALGTYASRVLSAGMVVDKINGKNVSTLADYRKSFVPNSTVWELETDRGAVLAVDFRRELQSQVADGSASEHGAYLLTKAVQAAGEQILAEGLPQRLSEKAKVFRSDHVAHEVQELHAALETAGQAVVTAAKAAAAGAADSANVTTQSNGNSSKVLNFNDQAHMAKEVGKLAAVASATAKQAAAALDKITQFRKKLGTKPQ